jgi:hypothetical protein
MVVLRTFLKQHITVMKQEIAEELSKFVFNVGGVGF